MGNCLVTKLKESVQNDNLLKMGEIKFGIRTTQVNEIGLKFILKDGSTATLTSDVPVTFEGVTDTSFTVIGRVNEYSVFFPSAGDYNISFSNKYDIVTFDIYNSLYIKAAGALNSLNACTYNNKGDISVNLGEVLKGAPFGNNCYINGESYAKRVLMTGEIPTTIFTNWTTGNVFLNANVFSNNLAGITIPSTAAGTWLQILNSDITIPDIGALINGASINNVSFGGSPNIAGDLSSAGLVNVKEFRGYEATAASQPVFTWQGTRTGKFIYLNNVKFKTSNDVDNMLINLANLTDFEGVTKRILYYDSPIHTSASDAAIATLKANGVEISQNGNVI